MATTTAGDMPYEERSLFVRKATGLVRGWSVKDAFIYATFSINLITLGLYIFSYGPVHPEREPSLGRTPLGPYLLFQTIVYSSLIAAMPRAGGDYVWVSRVIGGGIGFVLAVCGWWFINWHWVPIYANILEKEFFQPLAAIIGWDSAVTFFGEPKGLFTASVITAVLAAFFISLGMRGYASAAEDVLLRRTCSAWPSSSACSSSTRRTRSSARSTRVRKTSTGRPATLTRRRSRPGTTRVRTTSRTLPSARPSCLFR